jgi:small neutral amino acid transporter SnatA (MarC family)
MPPERRVPIVLRECLVAYLLLIAFLAGGRTFMEWLQLSDVSLAIAGGIILFLIAMRMVFPTAEGVFGRPARRRAVLVPAGGARPIAARLQWPP